MNPKHPAGPPMTLGNMGDLAVRRLNVLDLHARNDRQQQGVHTPHEDARNPREG
jgi:hypothetical protein